MNYIGSKYSLLDFIDNTVRQVAGDDLSDCVFCDIFAGTGIIGRHFKTRVRRIIANDWEYYSYVLNRNYIGNTAEIANRYDRIDALNATEGIDDGFIYSQYCSGSGSGRMYFSDDNGRKIDAVRSTIERWKRGMEISDDLYYFLLCSLIETADKLANTASVYGAFLKRLKKSAQKPFVLLPADYLPDRHEHEVHRSDANELIRTIEGDILYLDPPYNARQYGANYHLLNTIAEYEPFVPKGKTGLREYTRSEYCSRKNVAESFDDLIRNARFRYILLSYNNEGLMPIDTIRRTMERYGTYDMAEKKYTRFRADKAENRHHTADSTIEYLHILEKRG